MNEEETIIEQKAPVRRRVALKATKRVKKDSQESSTLFDEEDSDSQKEYEAESKDVNMQNDVDTQTPLENSQNQVEDSKESQKKQERYYNNRNYNYSHTQDTQSYQRGGRKYYSRHQAAIEESDDEYNPDAPIMLVNDYNSLSITELRAKAVEFGLEADSIFEMKKQEIVAAILKKHAFAGGVIHASGTLEILQDGYGFLRSELNSYLQGPEDVFVPPQLIKSNGLRTGDTVYCMLRSPKASERFFAVYKVLKINGEDISKAKGRIPFDSLTPLYPDSRIQLEGKSHDLSMRIIDMYAPIGKGQRALITAPPRTGKTILLQKIANAITENYPEIKLMVLLVDERPEEVTDMRRNVKGEVVASTFDEQAQRHVNVAEMVIEKAKRYVEHGCDVVILLDSITRLARAYNQTAPASGKVLSGGVDSNALHKPKRFFGAARNIENGGSLTIIATALIETGSRMDEVIFEEFKGTGNCEIVLDRRMAEKRLYPAINLQKSGTRREELLIENEYLQRIWLLRNALSTMDDLAMSELILEKMKKSENNDAFMKLMTQSV